MINKAMILGRIGKKETKVLSNGNNVTILSIATTKKWVNQQGLAQVETTWHTVNCYSKLSDIVSKYAHVGQLIYIEGEIVIKKKMYENETKEFYSITCTEVKLIPIQKKVDVDGNAKGEEVSNEQEFNDPIPF